MSDDAPDSLIPYDQIVQEALRAVGKSEAAPGKPALSREMLQKLNPLLITVSPAGCTARCTAACAAGC
mgnify:CR=1 FL=1